MVVVAPRPATVVAVVAVLPALGADDPPPPPCGTAEAATAWWNGDGNSLDSRSRNDGLLFNSGFVTGFTGQAFSFLGTNDYLEIPNSGSLDLTGDVLVAVDAHAERARAVAVDADPDHGLARQRKQFVNGVHPAGFQLCHEVIEGRILGARALGCG